jgi:F-type H+-transporting ATPase subunit gamma
MARRGTLLLALGAAVLAAVAWHLRSAAGFVGGSAAQAGRQINVHRCGIDQKMKARIASVKKTGKLTDAMRLVAAAKVRKAQTGVEKARPFSDELSSMIKGLVKKLKGSGLEAELPMLRVPEKVQNVGIVLVTSNKGLCGAYNTFVMRKAEGRIRELNKQGVVPKLIIVGKKGVAGLKSKLNPEIKGIEWNYTGTFINFPDTVTSSSVAEVGDELRNLFLSGEADKIEVVYAKFFNLLKNEPQVRTMLPLTPTGIEDPNDETFALTSEDGKLSAEKVKTEKVKAKKIEPDVIFDQPPQVILNSMLPLYLNSQLLSILFDAQASELASRMTAMKAATDNAKELEEKLTLIFNKKRQAAITAELCEITAGAMSIESGDSRDGADLGTVDNEDTIGDELAREIEFGDLPDLPTPIEERDNIQDLVDAQIKRTTGTVA